MRAVHKVLDKAKRPLWPHKELTSQPINKYEKRQKHGLFGDRGDAASGGARGGAQTAPGPKHTEKSVGLQSAQLSFFFLFHDRARTPTTSDTMTEPVVEDEQRLQEHRHKYRDVVDALNGIQWQMDRPYLREASTASVRTVGAGVLLARLPTGAYREAPADAGLVTQYNLVLPCAEVELASSKRLYADVLVARSNRAFRAHDAPNWVVYSGMTREECHRIEDAFGTALDPDAVFCGVAPSLSMSCDSDGWEHCMALSNGAKTRYAPLDEAKAHRQQKAGEAQEKEAAPRRRRRGARGKKGRAKSNQ